MNAHAFTIGRVAALTGSNPQTIRYYESVGLLPQPARSQGNHRLYGEEHVQRLRFILRSRQLGFAVETVRQLLSLRDRPDQSCEVVTAIAHENISQIEGKIRQLYSLQQTLQEIVASCENKTVSECKIIESLAGIGSPAS